MRISKEFRPIEELEKENGANQRGIRTDRGIEKGKRCESTRDSERYRNRKRKTVRISKEFGPIEESKKENGLNQQGIQTDRGIGKGKRCEPARYSDR
ncbi:hypothetical protein ACM26V_19875 [Salipaludibacillus sp. HK11]|uniref:hypothetical protein n=1 Tax=Salipaludibacillus sp. HK11 TaxID=3394320 RepID=UPI0039FD2CDC